MVHVNLSRLGNALEVENRKLQVFFPFLAGTSLENLKGFLHTTMFLGHSWYLAISWFNCSDFKHQQKDSAHSSVLSMIFLFCHSWAKIVQRSLAG